MWKKYETKLFDFFKQTYPECEIEFDDSIFGIYSKIERQIDFAIRGNLAGKRILGIVDCIYYSKKIDIKTVESFIGIMQDVNANFALMITNRGYSQAAKNRVKYSNLKLDILQFNELNEIEPTVDYFFNQNIKGLELSKSEFYRRNRQNTAYFDKKNLIIKNV
ncbi:restriction endonuclease [Flavobacterium sp. CSZ]|uniref:restriction endonuclease n=1 Tax=Flavobacterium sp. CSZ TaxID=2783791 RepID=UPI00188A3AB3|nr:restriction endonuclease [Flavobacterium sp. CSZ]MBF4486226.1 restriction endonuclease [Flavobacterium sp. CSZ]